MNTLKIFLDNNNYLDFISYCNLLDNKTKLQYIECLLCTYNLSFSNFKFLLGFYTKKTITHDILHNILLSCITNKHIKMIEYLLSKFKFDINKNSKTLLNACNNNSVIIKLLMDYGALIPDSMIDNKITMQYNNGTQNKIDINKKSLNIYR